MKSTIQDRRGVTRKLRVEQFRAAESEQDHGQQVGSGADHQVGKARDDGAERADEILRGAVRRRDVAERDPGGQIPRGVGDQREEKQRAGAEEKEGEDFIPRGVFDEFGPLRLTVMRERGLSISFREDA